MAGIFDGKVALQSILPEGHGLDEKQQALMAAALEALLRKIHKDGGITGMQMAYFAMGVDFDADAWRDQPTI